MVDACRTAVRIDPAVQSPLNGGRYERLRATLAELRDHPYTRTLAIGMQVLRHGRYGLILLAKTRLRSGQRDYLLFEEPLEWEIEPDSEARTRSLLERFAADWPNDRPLYAFKTVIPMTRRMSTQMVVQRLIDREKVMIEPSALVQWHDRWITEHTAPPLERLRSEAIA